MRECSSKQELQVSRQWLSLHPNNSFFHTRTKVRCSNNGNTGCWFQNTCSYL
jgi:hypothetical protein